MSMSLRKLHEVESFTEAAAAVYVDGSITAQEKGRLIVQRYENSIERLRVAGELTPRVEREFRGFAEMSLRQIQGLTQELGLSLTELIERYRPGLTPLIRTPLIRTRWAEMQYRGYTPPTIGEKRSNWWVRKFLPWWQNDSW